MKRNHLLTLTFLLIFITINAARCSQDVLPHRGGIAWLGSSMLNLICKPLNYFAVSESLEPSYSDIYQKAWQTLIGSEADTEKMKTAYEMLEICAIEGDPHGLYHMGRLMMAMPEDHWRRLLPMVPENLLMAKNYLEAAKALGVKDDKNMLGQHNSLEIMMRAVEYAAEETAEGLTTAKLHIKALLHLKSAHASFYVAEALLKGNNSTFPWMDLSEHKTLGQRRNAALPLLSVASKYNLSMLDELYKWLAEEDQVYEEVCSRIYDAASRGEKINNLTLGESGYQEAFIDDLCSQGVIIKGRVITQELALFLKHAMAVRVAFVHHFYMDYFQYLRQASEAQLALGGQVDISVGMELMRNKLVGLYEIALPKITEDIYDPKISPQKRVYDFRKSGLFCPITILDSTTAYRKMMEADDDFNGVNFAEELRLEEN